MSDQALSPAVLSAWAALLLTERALRDKVEEKLKQAGLPPLDWYHVLNEIDTSARGFVRQAAVQRSTQLAQYNVCRLVDRLQRDGLVERRPCTVDGRNNVVVITERGRALRRSMWPVYAEAIQAHFGSLLSPQEARQLSDLLAKLRNACDGGAPNAGPAGPRQPLV